MAYCDRWIECLDSAIRVRAYYFPWGTKTIPYASIRTAVRMPIGPLSGSARIWGTGTLRYWASLDPQRPHKSIAFVLDNGRLVKPLLTPDDPDAFATELRRRRVDISSAPTSRPQPGFA